MDNKENNKRIAEFMGWKRGVGKGTYWIPEGYKLIDYVETTFESNWGMFLEELDSCTPVDMKFNTQWDWLMPVVEEIHRTKEASIEIHSNSTKISHKGKTKIFAGGLGDSLDNTYRAVLEYINDN